MIIELAKGVALLGILTLCHSFITLRWRDNALSGQLVSGLLFGLICIVGMKYPLQLQPGVIFDARSVILSIAGLFGGPVAAVIAALMSAAYRIWIGGAGVFVGIGVITTSATLGIAFYYARRRHGFSLGVMNLLVFGTIVQGTALLWFLALPVEVVWQVLASVALPFCLAFVPATLLFGLLLRDVEVRINLESELIATGQRYKALYNQSPVLMHSLDGDGVVTDVNDYWLQTMGYARDEVIGHKISDFMTPESCAAFLTDFPRLQRKGELHDLERQLVTKDGRYLDVRVQARAERREAGKVTSILSVMTNITEQKEQEAALVRAQKMEAVGELTGGIAHDFNNMLTVIIGNTELAAAATMDHPQLQRYMRRIRMAAERGKSLTQGMLAFARRQPLAPQPTDINVLIGTLGEIIPATLGESVHVEFQLADSLWPAMVDGNELEHAIVNIVLNARDAMGGSGTLTIATENVTLTDADAQRFTDLVPGNYVKIMVGDTGSGIPPEIVDKVFQPFFTTKGVGEGTGLGLSVVYGFVNQTGGQVAIDSVPGDGTNVALYLPRAADAPDGTRPSTANRAERGGSESVLVVEDDEEVRRFPVSVLKQHGYRVHAVQDGQSALAALDSGAAYDLLFTDLVLPGDMTGVDIALAAQQRYPTIRVLFTTGNSSNFRGTDLPEPLLRKPYDSQSLLGEVRRVLDAPATTGTSP